MTLCPEPDSGTANARKIETANAPFGYSNRFFISNPLLLTRHSLNRTPSRNCQGTARQHVSPRTDMPTFSRRAARVGWQVGSGKLLLRRGDGEFHESAFVQGELEVERFHIAEVWKIQTKMPGPPSTIFEWRRNL